jgi:predicted cupin superfamily sugar epimerase
MQYFKLPRLVKAIDEKRYHGETRHTKTSIYYLLTYDDFSVWHKIKSDEH